MAIRNDSVQANGDGDGDRGMMDTRSVPHIPGRA